MKHQTTATDIKSKIDNSIIFGNCRKVDTILFKIVDGVIFYEYKYYELNDNNRVIYVGESESQLHDIDKPNCLLIKGLQDKEKCPYETLIRIFVGNIEEDGSYDIDIYLEKIIENNISLEETKRKSYFQTHKEKINSKCLFGNIIITASQNLPIVTYSEKSYDIPNYLTVVDLPETKFSSLDIPMQIEESIFKSRITQCNIEKPKDIFNRLLDNSFSKEKIKYNRKGEVIYYENPETKIKMKLKKRKYGYTEEIYFEDKLISFIDVEDSPTIERFCRRFLNFIGFSETFKKDKVELRYKGPIISEHIEYEIRDVISFNKRILSDKNISNYNFHKFEDLCTSPFHELNSTEIKDFNIIKKYGENNIITLSNNNGIILECGNIKIRPNYRDYNSEFADKFGIYFYSGESMRIDERPYNYMDNEFIIQFNYKHIDRRVSIFNYEPVFSNNKEYENVYIRDMFGIPRLINNIKFDMGPFHHDKYDIIEQILKEEREKLYS